MHFIQSIKQTYTFFRWLRNSLIQDGVDILLRYQTILFYASMLWAIYGMSQEQAHDLLKVFIWSSLPKIRNHESPQIVLSNSYRLMFSLLFVAGLGTSKCQQYQITKSDIMVSFEEYSECHVLF